MYMLNQRDYINSENISRLFYMPVSTGGYDINSTQIMET